MLKNKKYVWMGLGATLLGVVSYALYSRMDTLMAEVEAKPSGVTLVSERVAVTNGDLVLLQQKLKEGSLNNAPGTDGKTPEHVAAQKGHVEILKLYASAGLIKNGLDFDGASPIHHAHQNKRTDVLEFYTSLGLLTKDPDKTQLMPELWAAENGNVEVLQAYQKAGKLKNERTPKGWMPEELAAQNGHDDVLKIYLEAKLLKNEKNKNNATPEGMAAQAGFEKVLKVYQTAGLLKNEPEGENGKTPEYMAVENGKLEIVKMYKDANLLKNSFILSCLGVSWIEEKPKTSAELIAVKKGYVNIVKIYGELKLLRNEVECDPEVDCCRAHEMSGDYDRTTPEAEMARKDNQELFEFYKKNSLIKNEPTHSGVWAEIFFIENNRIENLKFYRDKNLLHGYPDILKVAAQKGHVEALKLYSKESLSNGNFVEQSAAENGKVNVIKYLAEIGLLKADTWNSYYSPERLAASEGHVAVLKVYQEKGLLKNTDSIPEAWAARNGHLDVLKYYQSLGLLKNSLVKNHFSPEAGAVEKNQMDVLKYYKGLNMIRNQPSCFECCGGFSVECDSDDGGCPCDEDVATPEEHGIRGYHYDDITKFYKQWHAEQAKAPQVTPATVSQ